MFRNSIKKNFKKEASESPESTANSDFQLLVRAPLDFTSTSGRVSVLFYSHLSYMLVFSLLVYTERNLQERKHASFIFKNK